MLERPEQFRLNPFAPLAQGLVFAGLGGYGAAGSSLYPDSSGYGNHGTLTAMDPPTDWQFVPQLGRWALDFDGSNDRVSLAPVDDTRFEFPSRFSASIWVNLRSVTQYNTIFSCVNSMGGGWRLWTRDSADYKWYWECFDTATRNVVSTESIATDVYVHVVGVHDGTYLRIFINGIESGSPTACGVVTYGTSYLAATNISSMSDIQSSSSFFRFINGLCSDALIHNRALSPAEIQQLADPSNAMLSGLIRAPKRRLFAVSAAAPAFKAAWAIRRNQTIGTGVI